MRITIILVSILLGTGLTVNSAFAKWVQIETAEELTALYSDTTLSFTFKGQKAKGEYCAEGTGFLKAPWGNSSRKWWVKGNDQICIDANDKVTCYKYSRNDKKENKVRAIAVSDYLKINMTVKPGRPPSCDE